MRTRRTPPLVLLLLGTLALSGCAAAIGAAVAAGEIRRGIGGLQQLVAFTRPLPPAAELVLPPDLGAPLAGTYRGYQAIGGDTLHFYVRTARESIAPILDESGTVTGYALPGLAAVSLDTLETRVSEWRSAGGSSAGGRAIFFVEGTQAPNIAGRTLYPAAFLGRVSVRESEAAARHDALLREMELPMDAPAFGELIGQGIPHELFGSVAEGVFTVRADGGAVYRQEYGLEEGGVLVLHFERISRTTLP
jgi:hypothetical protein